MSGACHIRELVSVVYQSDVRRKQIVEEMETLEKGLVIAGVEALRQIGGETLVQVVFGQAEMRDFARTETLPDEVSLAEYLRYRDTLLDFLHESFCMVAFQTGQILMRTLHHEKESQIKRLIEQFKY